MSEDREREKAYREGYSQGANAAVEAFAKNASSSADVTLMRAWVQQLYNWRYGETNEMIVPPTAPLNKQS